MSLADQPQRSNASPSTAGQTGKTIACKPSNPPQAVGVEAETGYIPTALGRPARCFNRNTGWSKPLQFKDGGMRCPYCQHDNDRVMDTRANDDGFSVRRRRFCNNCKRRFTTYERIEEVGIRVIKKDHVREALNREKIRGGIETACWKRPISRERIDSVVEQIVARIHSEYEDEVSSRQVGEIVMMFLAELDAVAYVRFASVYREFDDLNDFVRVLQNRSVSPTE